MLVSMGRMFQIKDVHRVLKARAALKGCRGRGLARVRDDAA
jgi:hypothetical protein